MSENQIINKDDKVLENDDVLDPKMINDDNIYPMNNIKVEKGFFTVFELKRKYDMAEKRIILDSDFQRDDVWNKSQKAELIESVLMGLPLPIFYFNQDKQGRLIVVDGRQRLTALFDFMSNKWPLRNLNVLSNLNKKYFRDLTPLEQSQLEDYQIQAHVIKPPTPDRIKFDIFDRVNRAGTQLNKQEIRNALYQGKATSLLKKLTEREEFIKATGNAFDKRSRMKDRYIILRYIAFEFLINGDLLNYEYKNDIDDLLGKTMEYMNSMSDKEIKRISDDIIHTLMKVNMVFTENAFKLYNVNGKYGPINMNVFETLMYFMRRVDIKNNEQIIKIEELVNKMKNNYKFRNAIGNHRDNINKIKLRFNIMNKMLEELND